MTTALSTLRCCPTCILRGAVLVWPRADVLPMGARASLTRYADDARNVVPEMCDECYQEYVDHWRERWAEYWSMVL